MYGGLRRVKAVAVNDKLVALGNATKDGSIVEHQAGASRPGSLGENKAAERPEKPPPTITQSKVSPVSITWTALSY